MNKIERLHQCIRSAAESVDSFMRANEQLRAEREVASIFRKMADDLDTKGDEE